MRTPERTMYLQASCSIVLGVSLWSNSKINYVFSPIKVTTVLNKERSNNIFGEQIQCYLNCSIVVFFCMP